MTKEDTDNGGRSWFERLSQALQGEPQDRDQLVDVLRDAEQRELLDQGIRELVLHEMGHSLGLSHNFIASQMFCPLLEPEPSTPIATSAPSFSSSQMGGT